MAADKIYLNFYRGDIKGFIGDKGGGLFNIFFN